LATAFDNLSTASSAFKRKSDNSHSSSFASPSGLGPVDLRLKPGLVRRGVRGIRRIGLLLLCGEARRGKRKEGGQTGVVVVMAVFRVGDAFMLDNYSL
jgi:hypothetical protein